MYENNLGERVRRNKGRGLKKKKEKKNNLNYIFHSIISSPNFFIKIFWDISLQF